MAHFLLIAAPEIEVDSGFTSGYGRRNVMILRMMIVPASEDQEISAFDNTMMEVHVQHN